jgi:hypothetical protein
MLKFLKLFCALLIAFSSYSAFAIDSDKLSPEEILLLQSSDFPLSSLQVQTVFREADRLVPDMIPSLETSFQWTNGESATEEASFAQFSDQIQIPRFLGNKISIVDLRKKEGRQEYLYHVSNILTHEYGHALLHLNLYQDVKIFREIHDRLAELNARNIMRIPSDIYMNAQLMHAYSEFFADALVFAKTRDSAAMTESIEYGYGNTFGNVLYRNFKIKTPGKTVRIVRQQVRQANESSVFHAYATLAGQRYLLAQYLEKNPEQSSQMLAALYKTIREEAEDKLAIPSLNMGLQGVIQSFEISLKKNLGLE